MMSWEENDIYRYDIPKFLWDMKDKQMIDGVLWIVEEKSSLRKAAREWGVSKSSLHRYIHSRLKEISDEVYCIVKKQLIENRKMSKKR